MTSKNGPPKLNKISEEKLIRIASRFKALGEPNRLKIIQLLHKQDLTVTQLVDKTSLSQSNVSQHLKILINVGLIKKQRFGLNALYFIADETLAELCGVACRGVK